MPLKQIESYPSGGVSSRDNPISYPADRYLRMVNFWPQQDGSLRLRDGYTLYVEGIDQGVPIHSITGVVGPGPDYKRLIVFWQGTTPYVLDPDTKEIVAPIVRGVPIQSSDRFCYFYTNGHLHAFNGTDAKWYDGFVWRDIGLPLPDATSIAAMTVVASVREFSNAEAGAVTLTLAGGGTFPADKTGRTFYCAIYDLDQQEIGPATIPIGPSNGFKKFALNQELQVAVLPSLTNARWRKLPALTDDGKNDAHFVAGPGLAIADGQILNQSFALAGSSASNNPTKFANPSFAVSLSAQDLGAGPSIATISGSEQSIPDANLAASAIIGVSGDCATEDVIIGGIDRTVFDSGTIGISVTGTNNYAKTFTFTYNAGSTAASLAQLLASAIQVEGLLSATVSGSDITVTPTAKGGGNVYVIGKPFTHTNKPQYFQDGDSFTITKSVDQFGQRTIFDTGAVAVSVNSSSASVPYGPNDTAVSVALLLASALNGLNIGIQASALGSEITISVANTGVFINLIVPSHGCAIDDVIGISASGDAAYDGQLFTVLDAITDVFKIFVPLASLAITSGIVQRLLSITGTTATITSPVFFLPYRVNDLRGIPGSSIGGPDAGFQFYGSLYKRTAGGHVGNRVKIGQRVVPATRSNVRMLGTISFADDEDELLIGRTADGAEVPHACIDNDGTWLSVKGTSGVVAIIDSDTDGNAELPARNFPPPGTLDFNAQIAPDDPIAGTFKIAWVESDHCCGALKGQPTAYRSGSAQDNREGKFVGLPEQSWSPADIETFPTAAPISGGHGYSGESLIFSKEDSATLIELAGETGWQGPYNIGGAGQFAYAKGWKNLPYSLTGEKQLATVSPDGPIPISEEYEQALLSKIGDKYLGDAEIIPVKLPHKRVEVLRISARDKNGDSFTVIHDFNLRDQRSPYGQAYEERLLGDVGFAPTFTTPHTTIARAGGIVTFTRLFTVPIFFVPTTRSRVKVSNGGTFDGSFQVSEVSYTGFPPPSQNHLLTVKWEQAGSDETAFSDVQFSDPYPPTFAVVRDENDQPLVLAGGGDGNLYKLYDGISDNGEFFTGEALSLKYVGPQHTAIKFLEWYGDPNAKFFIAKKLTSVFDPSQMTALCPDDDKMPDEAQGDEGSNHYVVNITDSEMVHVYVLLQLKGYEGGTMDLNDPPHMPVESYGRVLMVSPSAGAGRP